MELRGEVRACMNKSVLCWLATTSSDGTPNVSPKEVFTHFGTDKIVVANIASPQTVKNIKLNEKVCISFIDILVQKGFQIKGKAQIIDKVHADFKDIETQLLKLTGGKFPFNTITLIGVDKVKPIIAPRYLLYPDTTEQEQIESAKRIYGFENSKR